jgi:hypothetical protein
MDDFKNDPIYQEELIRERARLDEKARRDKEAGAKKKAKESREKRTRLVVNIIIWTAVVYTLGKIIWVIGPFRLPQHLW